jgi:hypothetical protein
LTARKVNLQHVYYSDGLAEKVFGCGGRIVGIVGFEFAAQSSFGTTHLATIRTKAQDEIHHVEPGYFPAQN